MLERLSVRNLAIVEQAEADFGAGLNVITGETGAGKSVFMGALALVLGARADAAAVREGASEARIEAVFDLSAAGEAGARAAALLDGQGLPPAEEGRLLVRRTIGAKGGSRVWINDAAATVQTLRALGAVLVDVHGADDRKSLLDEGFQRAVLDGRAPSAPKTAYAAAWKTYAEAVAACDALRAADVSEEELERLRFSTEELAAAALTDEDETELPARHAAAAHATEILDAANAVTEALGGEAEASAANALYAATAHLRDLVRHYAPAADWIDRAERLATDVQELSRDVADVANRVEADPAALAALDDRLSLVQRLKRKYRCATVADLLALAEERTRRLADLQDREARLAALEAQAAAARKDVLKAGAALSDARRKAADRLAKAVTKELRALGFLKAGFAIALETREPDASGCDAVTYRFAPNPGEPARDLAAIASTGELARVMLALKTVTAEADRTDVLVFDEVDANIGGETGRAVGLKLRTVAEHRQVIAITHLPQTAACGETHFAVAKSVVDGRTKSVIRALSADARLNEIVRMLGGRTDAARQHARDLLAGR